VPLEVELADHAEVRLPDAADHGIAAGLVVVEVVRARMLPPVVMRA
jgi:hypothetical protein